MLIFNYTQAYFVQYRVSFLRCYTHYTSALSASNRLCLNAPRRRFSANNIRAGHDSHFTDVRLRRQEYMDFTRSSICTLDLFIVVEHANPRHSVQQWGNSNPTLKLWGENSETSLTREVQAPSCDQLGETEKWFLKLYKGQWLTWLVEWLICFLKKSLINYFNDDWLTIKLLINWLNKYSTNY